MTEMITLLYTYRNLYLMEFATRKLGSAFRNEEPLRYISTIGFQPN
jgi:hypothetical protein